MRSEQSLKSKVTFGKIADMVSRHSIDDLDELTDSEIHTRAQANYRKALQEIRAVQATSKEDGYIVHQDVVYRVHHGNGQQLKLTGTEAKEIKRLLKSL